MDAKFRQSPSVSGERLRFSQYTDNSLLEYINTAILVLDVELRILYANTSAEQLFTLSRSRLNGHFISDYHWQEDSYLWAMHHALADKLPYTCREARLYLPSNEQIVTLDYTATPNAEGTELLLEFFPQDRILRLSKEDNLFTTNQATRALILGMAHEVRNPLGGIRGATQLLARELHNPSLNEYTNIILSEVERLGLLVERMLSSHKALEIKPINIHQVLERVYAVLKAEVGDAISFVRDYDPSLPELWADLDQLIQVVLNIARNAAQALLEDEYSRLPHIIFRTRVLRQCTIGTTRHRMACLIEVEDNGPGISQSLQEMLFYPMVTGRAQGTGLGLPIAQAIMQQHKGLIECHSHPKQTIFRILIPFSREQSL